MRAKERQMRNSWLASQSRPNHTRDERNDHILDNTDERRRNAPSESGIVAVRGEREEGDLLALERYRDRLRNRRQAYKVIVSIRDEGGKRQKRARAQGARSSGHCAPSERDAARRGRRRARDE